MELGISRDSSGAVKKIGVIAGVLVILVVAAWLLSGTLSSTGVNAYFTPNNVRAGETITLIVEVTNTLGENANSLTVDLANGSYDKSVLAFDKEADTLNFVARGDVRKFYFTGMVLSDDHPGLYHIDVITELDGQTETVRPVLEVTQ